MQAALLMVLGGLLAATDCLAATLRVGPAEPIRTIAEAARRAGDGDTVLIAAGRYVECATWRANDLRIAADGPGEVEVTGPVCGDKALFVIAGARVTVAGITFRGASNAEGNAAGIRAEGAGLVIRDSHFIANQNGVLTASVPDGTLLVEDSSFIDNGALVHECAHGLYANRLALVSIRRTSFEGTRTCHHVKSRALRTEIRDSVIRDGPAGDTSYLIDIPNGGGLLLEGTDLAKGPRSSNRGAAVVIGAEGATNPAAPIVVTGNRLTNLMSGPTVFLRNRTTEPAQLSGNHLEGPVTPLEGAGRVLP